MIGVEGRQGTKELSCSITLCFGTELRPEIGTLNIFFSPLNSPILRSSGHLQDMHDHTHIQYSKELINLKIMKQVIL